MNEQSTNLDRRIELAVQPGTAITSADLGALIEKVEAVIAEADKERAVDPTLSRQATMDAILTANRLSPLLSELQARYEQVHEREQTAAWLAEYEAARQAENDKWKRERDALAEELREVYPEAITKLVDLFIRIDANDKALAELRRDRPSGEGQHLVSAELHARGLDSFSYNKPSHLTSMVLFDWDSGHQVWPLPRPSRAAAVATSGMSMVAYNPAHWATNSEQRAAAQQRDRQRHADFLARLTKEQEERQNREAREAFDESQRRSGS